MRRLMIGPNEAGQRLDKYLGKILAEAPKSFLYRMLRKKNITLNGKKAAGSEILSQEDVVTLFLSEDTIEKFSREKFQKTAYNLDILYENHDVLLVNKPAGVLSQRQDTRENSMVEQIISYLLDSGAVSEQELNSFRPGICNRLDRNTSGILIAGKSLAGLQILSELIRTHRVKKYYLCLVKGVITGRHRIKGYLYKDTEQNLVRVSESFPEGGVPIETIYEACGNNGKYTLCRVLLVTGRTHQIRSHLASIGHPVIGDRKYGDEKTNEIFRKKYGLCRQLLHAWELHIPVLQPDALHISGKVFRAELPEDFANILLGEHLEESINGGKKKKKEKYHTAGSMGIR